MNCRRGDHRGIVFGVAAALLATSLGAAPAGQDWPQLRGLQRDGVSAESGLLREWPEGGPREIWRVPLGAGFSGIAAVGDRLYTAYAADREGQATEFAAAFEAATGKLLWRTAIGKAFKNEFGDGPRATPTIDGDQLYVLGSYGDLVALAVADGAERWRVQLVERFGSKVPTFGFSGSALVDGDRLVLESGGKEGKSYAALNKKTGETLWTFGDGPDEPGYNSPIAFTVGGKQRYAYIVGGNLVCLDRDGKEIWRHPWVFPGETHAMPVFVPPDRIFASGAEGVGATLLRVDEAGGAARVETLWKSGEMRNHWSASVVHDGHLYGFDNATLRCMSLETGKTAWVKRGMGKGSLIYADGRLFVLSDQGVLALVEATPVGFRQRGSAQVLTGRTWTSPTLSRGKLCLRGHEDLVCYDVAG